jgi:hypothetical protein
MGRKAKRLKIAARIARLTGEQETAPQPTLVAENSQKIEELKTKIPEPVIEEPITLEEPKFMTEAEPVKVEEKEAPKIQVKKTTKKRTPRKKTSPRARKTNLKSKNKSISSEK